jgi:hypothetical protein
VDPSHLFWRNALSLSARYLKTEGVTEERMDAVLRVISPLAMQPLAPVKHRAIFAGVTDRVIPPVEADTLWRHWERPRIEWYDGPHRAFLGTPEGRALVEETLRGAGVLPENV